MARGFGQGGTVWGRLLGRLAAALLLTVGLSACAIPPAVSIVSMAADGVLLAATGKSKTDHGLSLATGKDCATLRALDGEDVCQERVVARLEPLPAEVERDLDTLRSAPRQPDQFSRGDAALAAAFDAPAPAPVVLAAAPRPAPVVLAAAHPARTGPAKVQVAALRLPSGVTPGRVKVERPAAARAVVAVRAVSSAKAAIRLAKAKRHHLATVKGKSLAAAAKARGRASPAKAEMRAARLTVPPPRGAVPAPRLSRAPPVLQLALANP